MGTLASGKTLRLTKKLVPADTTLTGNINVGTTAGCLFLSNNNQVEWVYFTGITNNGDGTYTYTGLIRGISQTADPISGGTGSTWIANQEAILVEAHFQAIDKTQDTNISGTFTFLNDINFSGTTKGGLQIKTLTTAQRDAITPLVGYIIFNITTGTVQMYYGGTWNDVGTSTTPNASTTVAGKVEMATQAEVNAGTQIGGTGAFLSAGPDTIKVVTDALSTSISTVSSSIGSTTMTLGETLATGDVVSIDSATGKIFKTLLQGSDTTIISGSGNITLAKVVALSSTTVVFCGKQATSGVFYTRAGTISGNTISLGAQVNVSGGTGTTPLFMDLIALDSTTFAVACGYQTSNYFLDVQVGTVSGNTITVGSYAGILNGFVGVASATTFGALTKVTSTKFAVSYTYGASNRMTVSTVSGTTVSPGAEVGSFAFLPTASCYVSNDKFLLSEGTNARLYTTSGTVPTQGNNLALPATYTSIGLRDIGSSKSIFCGTNATNTIAFIIDASGTTPTNGTAVTVLAASTSNDCFQASATMVGIVTGNNKVYFYSYSGTTLSFENTITTTSSIGTYKSVDYLIDNIFINSFTVTTVGTGYVMSNRVHYVVGILQSSGVLNDSRVVKILGGISTIHSSLTTGFAYYFSNSGIVTSSGTFYIGKALSATSILVGIPYSTL